MNELIVDNFAGGGGASTGLEMALGRPVDHAINHDPVALGMHRINHPQTVHHCEDVFDVDPLVLTEGRPVGLGWFSPDCKHFSKAKGGKPLSKKIRGLAFIILRWAKIDVRVVMMENVEEIQTWGPLLRSGRPDPKHKGRTWRSFLAALGPGLAPDCPDIAEILDVLGDSITREELIRGLGYTVEARELRACDYGAPTIRKRLYLIARRDGCPIVWPEPTHAAPEKARCLGGLQPYRTAAEQIDWSVPCRSIFLSHAAARAFRCKRPLAPATLRRIAKGIDRYVLRAAKPFLVSLTHQGIDETALCDATVAPFITEHALVAAYLAQHNGGFNTTPGHPVSAPASTISAKGSQQQVVLVNLCVYYGNDKDGQPLDAPARTVTTKQRFGLCESLAASGGLSGAQASAARRVADFLHTHGVEFEGEFATLTIDGICYVIIDVAMRMMTPRELFRFQGFPDSYEIDRAWLIDLKTGRIREKALTKEEQIRMCGNSVCPDVAKALATANVPELAGSFTCELQQKELARP